jgi:lauroyl/myristoyl acyltransferase
MENLEAADAEGKGVLCLLAHHGNAHKHVFMYAVGRPYRLVMWHPDTTPVPRYTRRLISTTRAMGSGSDDFVIWVGPGFDTIKEVAESLEEGRRVGIPFDVCGNRVVEFFGRPSAVADGMGHWAFDAGCPIVPITLLHTPNPYKCRLVIGEPLSYELTGERKADIGAIMQAVATAGEELIRLAPDQWMSWFGLWQWWTEAGEIRTAKQADRV